MRCPSRADRGSVTAEFAVVMPAVVLVLIFALSAAQLAGQQLRLQAAVAGAARSAGRGASDGLSEVDEVSVNATLTLTHRGDLVCGHATMPARFGILIGITISATSCALADGQ